MPGTFSSASPAPNAPLHHLDNCTVGFTFILPDILSHVVVLRKTFCGLSNHIGIHRQDIDDLEMIIGELATNAVRHARGGSYRVHVDLAAGHATVAVIDQSDGFFPDAVAEPGTERADQLSPEEAATRIGGFGLPMVRMLADQVDVATNQKPTKGMTVRATKKLQPPQLPQS